MKKHIIALLCISAVSALIGALSADFTAADSGALAVIGSAVYAAVCHMRRKKKDGSCIGCGGCSGCSYQGDCEKWKQK